MMKITQIYMYELMQLYANILNNMLFCCSTKYE